MTEETPASEDRGLIGGALDAVGDFVEDVTEGLESSAIDARLQQYSGYEEFKAKLLDENSPLASMMGDDVEMSRVELLQRLEHLAVADAEMTGGSDQSLFDRINVIMEAEGFDELAANINEHDSLRAIFVDALNSDQALNPQDTVAALRSVQASIEEDPNYLSTLNAGIEDHPNLVSIAANRIAGHRDGPMAGIQDFMSNGIFGFGLNDILNGGGFDMGNLSFENFGQVLVSVFTGLYNMIGGMAMSAMNLLDNDPDLTQGNGAIPEQARPETEVGPEAPTVVAGQEPEVERNGPTPTTPS